jgi:hypothetical protein
MCVSVPALSVQVRTFVTRQLHFHYVINICYNTDSIENTASNSSSIVARLFAAGTFLPSRCLPTAVCSGSVVPVCWGRYTQTAI